MHYHDPKLNLMLERIIVNPIETPRGYKNPDKGIALRGPLSQFFSGLYLKPLDDAFNMQEHCAKRASKLSGWSKMGFLPDESSVTCIDGVCGG